VSRRTTLTHESGSAYDPEGSLEDIFVHYREIRGQGYRTLNEGQKVEFTLNKSDKGLAAQDVEVDEEEGAAPPPPVAN